MHGNPGTWGGGTSHETISLNQCVFQAVSREFICEECQNITLNKLESMLEILQTDTKQGVVTPTEIGDNILNIMGEGPPTGTVKMFKNALKF